MTQKDKTQLIITLFLVLVFVAVLFRAGKRMNRGETPVLPAITGAAPAEGDAIDIVRYARLRQAADILEPGRDPFIPVPVKPKPAGPVFELMGIVEEGGVLTAFINDSIVEVGDDVNGFKVESISRDRVVLSDGVKTIELTLGGY